MKTVKISELVEALNAIKEAHGDLVVGVACGMDEVTCGMADVKYVVKNDASDFLSLIDSKAVVELYRDKDGILQNEIAESGFNQCLEISGSN